MRHERIADIAAAAWPSTLEGLVLTEAPLAEAAPDDSAPLRPTPAAPDVAAGVGILIIGAYAALILVFFALFAGSATALFMVCIAAGFAVTFFTIPRIFFAIEADPSRRPSLPAFMHSGLQTATGHSSGRDALIQMLIVPVLLTLGLAIMGIVGKVYIG
jgi:hypothetical protein